MCFTNLAHPFQKSCTQIVSPIHWWKGSNLSDMVSHFWMLEENNFCASVIIEFLQQNETKRRANLHTLEWERNVNDSLNRCFTQRLMDLKWRLNQVVPSLTKNIRLNVLCEKYERERERERERELWSFGLQTYTVSMCTAFDTISSHMRIVDNVSSGNNFVWWILARNTRKDSNVGKQCFYVAWKGLKTTVRCWMTMNTSNKLARMSSSFQLTSSAWKLTVISLHGKWHSVVGALPTVFRCFAFVDKFCMWTVLDLLFPYGRQRKPFAMSACEQLCFLNKNRRKGSVGFISD